MGFGMATSLKRARSTVTGCDVSADSVARFVKMAARARRPRRKPRDAGIVVASSSTPRRPKPSCSVRTASPRPCQGCRLYFVGSIVPYVANAGSPRNSKQPAGTISDAPIPAVRSAPRKASSPFGLGSAAAFAKARPALDAMAAKSTSSATRRARARPSR